MLAIGLVKAGGRNSKKGVPTNHTRRPSFGMSSISSLLRGAKSQSLRIHDDLIQLEQSNPAFDSNVASLESRVNTALAELEVKIRKLRKLAAQESAARRPLWEAKVRNISSTCANLRATFDDHRTKVARSETIQQQRDALFGDAEGGMLARTDAELFGQEADSIARSNRMVDEYTEMSQANLEAIRRQGVQMKSAHRKLYDIANSLGVSRSLLRVIERRSFWDKLIVYSGMVVTLLVMFFMWRWARTVKPPTEARMTSVHNGM